MGIILPKREEKGFEKDELLTRWVRVIQIPLLIVQQIVFTLLSDKRVLMRFINQNPLVKTYSQYITQLDENRALIKRTLHPTNMSYYLNYPNKRASNVKVNT